MAAFIGNRPVVDAWGGDLGEVSLLHTWSAVKPVVGTCPLQLLERGQIGLDDPVADLWPELVAGTGGRLRLRHLLSHGAGLASLPSPGTASSLLNCDRVVARHWRRPNPTSLRARTSGSMP